ncbi:MAG: hypothetical protein ACE15C_07170 [Phycisphaerae bacterium]
MASDAPKLRECKTSCPVLVGALWAFFGFAMLSLSMLILIWVRVVPWFKQIFIEMQVKLPWVTEMVVSIPPAAAIIGGFLIVVLMVGKEFLLSRWANLWINIAVVLLSLMAGAILAIAIYAPMIALLQSVQGGAAGGE